MNEDNVDVLIVGGSHAGLSAAMALGRMRRSAIVVDIGSPRNESAEHANNIAGLDGVNPNSIRKQAKTDLKKYDTIGMIVGEVLTIKKQKDHFVSQLKSGKVVRSRKIILAFGVKDRLPEIPKIWDLWGKSVFHCPYCHGFEVKDKVIGMLDNGSAEHVLPLLKNISKDLVLFTNGENLLSHEFLEKIKLNNIPAFSEKIAGLKRDGDNLLSVALADGKEIKVDAILVGTKMPISLNSDLAKQLGCNINEMGLIDVDDKGKTSVEGVFAAGDIMTFQQSVVGATGTGQNAGASAVLELSHEEFNKGSK